MTGEQIEFIKNHFFKNYDYRGWASIAQKLLEDGECIIAGDDKLWYGGIGNFIKISPTDNALGCSLLTFDKESFLKSEWFKEQAEYYIKGLKHTLQDELYTITKLL